ncbi:MAG: carbon-nitrogen hydrolase family protein, partial [Amylibacter sp.]
MTNQPFRMLACQIDIPAMTTAEDRDAHLEVSAAKVRAALRKAPADLVVLPELSSIDYSRAAFENLYDLAEPFDGASFVCWRQVAREFNCHIAYSFARRDGDVYYICLAVVNPEGTLIGHYD